MVELKGAGDIPHAFAQLAYVKHQRLQYQEILEKFSGGEPGRITEKAFIITNGSLPKTARERLEKKYLIRVTEIIHGEASSKIPQDRGSGLAISLFSREFPFPCMMLSCCYYGTGLD